MDVLALVAISIPKWNRHDNVRNRHGGVVAFSVCRHVGDVAHSTSHEPTRSGMEPDVKKFVDFLVWVITFGGGRISHV